MREREIKSERWVASFREYVSVGESALSHDGGVGAQPPPRRLQLQRPYRPPSRQPAWKLLPPLLCVIRRNVEPAMLIQAKICCISSTLSSYSPGRTFSFRSLCAMHNSHSTCSIPSCCNRNTT